VIDITRLRENFQETKVLILKKDPTFDVDELAQLDTQLRDLRSATEELRMQRNELAKKGASGLTDELRAQAIELGKKLKAQEEALRALEEHYRALMLTCPNLPLDEVPVGNKEANKVVKEVGEKQSFSFTPQHHLELNKKLGWFDFETGAAMSGAQFALYRGEGVKLQHALLHLMLKNNVNHGYEPVMTPYLVSEQSLINSSNLPKFADELYRISEDNLYVIPTAEVPLTNVYANTIMPAQQLPTRMTAQTSCFRREAGGYGAKEHGLIRMHQFEKVEIYTVCTPDDSEQELERMLACAEELLKALGLHYRISLLAAQDCSFPSAKTYDIEVWLPGQQAYYEISSVSNCTDFQARRAKIRFRPSAEEKPKFVHTLNGSSLALPRLVVALMEQYQQEDGSIALPLVVQEAMALMW